ncbi:PIR Superfamily Protein [Plasmodium ovale curtisi]|uniref:PIR Superfamily Protein n=1 Tax=Plasmodium ovale curtisi TaxID=864141 RepID=A0A1A8X6I4_PLAOA|nr:PIR Superfamily Protein [Plasmodium ovale curtisi]
MSVYSMHLIALNYIKKCCDYNPDKVLSTLQCHNKSLEEIATEAVRGVPRLTSDHGTELHKENSDIGRKFGHSVLCVAPVLLTATALYRYTPVGSWVRKLGGYNSNSVSDMDEFSSYTQESEDMFSNNSGNYISYQPI